MEEMVLRFTGKETVMTNTYTKSHLISAGKHEMLNPFHNKMKTSDNINAGKKVLSNINTHTPWWKFPYFHQFGQRLLSIMYD